MKEVESVKADLETQKSNLDVAINEKNQKIAEYSQDIDAQKSLVEKYQKEMDAADAQIAEIQRKLAEQQAAQQWRKRKYYTTVLYTERWIIYVAGYTGKQNQLVFWTENITYSRCKF